MTFNGILVFFWGVLDDRGRKYFLKDKKEVIDDNTFSPYLGQPVQPFVDGEFFAPQTETSKRSNESATRNRTGK